MSDLYPPAGHSNWHEAFTRTCAHRLGFPRHEWPDLVQEAWMALASYEFDESRPGGASPSTIGYRIIENRLLHLRRSQRRYQGYITFQEELPDLPSTAPTPDQGLSRIELAEAIASLPEREQRVCEGLARGDCLTAIAQQNGHTWRTIQASIDIIRRRFAELGFDEWLIAGKREG